MSTENNKLIAEFMGAIVGKKFVAFPDIKLEDNLGMISNNRSFEDLHYHSSWDWLMPVVEKIESLSIVSFEKNLQEEGDYQCLFTKGSDILICHYADTSLQATYKAVVEFIKNFKTK
jgi:hypothetical protein